MAATTGDVYFKLIGIGCRRNTEQNVLTLLHNAKFFRQSFRLVLVSVTIRMICCMVTEWLETLTLILLTWRIWWAPNNASRW
jgi:hypothetical protein